ncbi:DUF2249 domain-containing protein [Devosia submarina]|uniref:DUF2249 domain-containing protein n=1 Tax=Devosia submarina TaxID=1173082 RepID=UPI000D35A3D6|nr:DUF2249 domain-containing protein [Devosia submarina]
MDDLELDVRPIQRNGGEPLSAIMGVVGRLAEGQGLRLLSTFKPVPLFSMMAAKGFTHEAQPLENGEWSVVFKPAGDFIEAPPPETWSAPKYYLDCTEPESPEPNKRILSRLGKMDRGEVLFALLHQEPQVLYPKLREGGHAWVGDFDEDGDNYRIMIRAGGSLY